jgi:hypothetical protein
MRLRILLALFLTAALCACAQQQPKGPGTTDVRAPVHLDATNCKAATAAQKTWVGRELADFARFAIACPVQAGTNTIVLYVVSLNAYDLDNSLPTGAPAPRLPKATIVLPDGTFAGTLPFAFPFDPPVSLDVTFTDWVAGLPRTVELFLEDPGVGGNRKLPPMKWDDKLRKYTEGTT